MTGAWCLQNCHLEFSAIFGPFWLKVISCLSLELLLRVEQLVFCCVFLLQPRQTSLRATQTDWVGSNDPGTTPLVRTGAGRVSDPEGHGSAGKATEKSIASDGGATSRSATRGHRRQPRRGRSMHPGRFGSSRGRGTTMRFF